MKRMLIPIIVSGALLLAAGCAPDTASSSPEGSNDSEEDHVENSIQVLGEGIGPLEITPDNSGSTRENQSSSDQSGGIISSSGNQSTSSVTDEQPGYVDSSSIETPNVNQEVDWLTYLDTAFKFSIDYPEFYVILPETEPLNHIDSTLVHRVRFQDVDLAEGDTAEYEIPKFTIEIFDLGSQSLDSFLENKVTGAELETIRIGELDGYKVSLNLLRAPNNHYYFPGNGMVYRLTPLGNYDDEMLESFKMLP